MDNQGSSTSSFNPDDFFEQLKQLNENLVDRFNAAKISLEQSDNPMHVQHAALSARSAMEIVSDYFPVASPITKASIKKEISKTIDLLERAIDPAQNLADLNPQFTAAEKISELRNLVELRDDTHSQRAFGVLSQIDPRYESLPPAIQKKREKMWLENWRNLNQLVHFQGKTLDRHFVEDSLDFLEGTLRYFFQPPVLASVNSIDALLSEFDGSNAEALFEIASEEFTNGAVLEYFLSKIDQAAWLPSLIGYGYFDTGRRSQKRWMPRQPHMLPPMRFLRRIAPSATDLAAEALGRIEDVESDELKGLIVDCAAACKPEDLLKLCYKLVHWDVRTSPYVSHDALLGICRRLFDAGYKKESLNFINSLLSFTKEDQPAYGLKSPFAEWDYMSFCKGVLNFLPADPSTFELFSDVLDRGIGFSTMPGASDLSIFWMPTLHGNRANDALDSIEAGLGAFVVSLIERGISHRAEDLPTYIDIMRNKKSDFFMRLGFVARAEAAPQAFDESWDVIFTDASVKATGAFTEIWLMARRLLEFASFEMVERLLSWLEDNNRNGTLTDSTYNRILSVLQTVGDDSIFQAHEALKARTGLSTHDRPELLVRTSGWVSESPPITAQRIQEIGPEGFLSFVDQWIPEDNFPMATRHTIAAELRTVLESMPGFLDRFTSRLSEYEEFIDVYLSTRIPLVESASESDLSVWLDVMEMSTKSAYYPAHSATSLMKHIYTSKNLSISNATSQRLWLHIEHLLGELVPLKPSEREVKAPFFFHQQAINDDYSMVLDTAIYAVSWMSNSDKIPYNLTSSQAAICSSLSRLGKNTVLPASILGVHFSFIASNFNDWSSQIIQSIRLETNEPSKFAFSSAHISLGKPTVEVLEGFPWIYEHSLANPSQSGADGAFAETKKIAAKQICIFFIQGSIESEHKLFTLIRTNFDNEEIDLLSREIGRTLWQSNSLTATIQHKSEELWSVFENLLDASSELGRSKLAGCFAEWFIISGLSPEWRLEKFTGLVQNGRFLISDLYSVFEEVAQIAEVHPLESLLLAKLLVMHSANKVELAWAAPMIFAMLSNIGESESKDIRQAATSLAAQMARSGFTQH